MTETQARINGATRLMAIVGDPIAQVRSPEIYNPLIAAAGTNAVLVPAQVPSERFEETVRGLMLLKNLDGIVVTYPFKERAMALVAEVGAVARTVGALNTMRRRPDGSWEGDMFDGAGLLAAVASLGQSVAGRRVLLMGAGGAGSAIAVSLAGAGAASIGIFDLDRSRAEALADRVRGDGGACEAFATSPDVSRADLLINATPVGMAPDFALAPFEGALHPGLTVVDIVPKPERTRLLEAAAAAGCPHVGGQAMVRGQAEIILKYFGFL